MEIERRNKINSLHLQLANELECGPTDKASALLHTLNLIKAVKRKYAGVGQNGLAGMAGGVAERRQGDDEDVEDEDDDD